MCECEHAALRRAPGPRVALAQPGPGPRETPACWPRWGLWLNSSVQRAVGATISSAQLAKGAGSKDCLGVATAPAKDTGPPSLVDVCLAGDSSPGPGQDARLCPSPGQGWGLGLTSGVLGPKSEASCLRAVWTALSNLRSLASAQAEYSQGKLSESGTLANPPGDSLCLAEWMSMVSGATFLCAPSSRKPSRLAQLTMLPSPL